MIIADLSNHTSLEFFERNIFLDDNEYILQFRYNKISNFWILTIKTTQTGEVLGTTKCINNFDLLRCVKTSTNLPEGLLFLINEDRNVSHPTQFDFQNKSTKLYYISRSEA